MFIHIGNNNTVSSKDIIAILDKNTVESSEATKEFIENLIKKDSLLDSDNEKIKSYIIIESAKTEGKYKIHTSNISSHALYQRMNR